MNSFFVPNKDSWESLGVHLKKNLVAWSFLDSEYKVKFFSSYPLALFDVVYATQVFLSHKKHLCYFSGACPYFDFLQSFWIREQKDLKSMSISEFPKTMEDAKHFVSELHKDTALVLFPEDHPVTGELYFWKNLDLALNEKRIPSIRLSHQGRSSVGEKLGPYSVRLVVKSHDQVFGFFGSRYRTPALISQHQVYDPQPEESLLFSPAVEDREIISEFEKQLEEFRFHGSEIERIWDRSFLVFPRVHGDRWTHWAQERFSSSGQIQALGSLPWVSLKNLKDWWPSTDEEKIDTLIAVPAEMIRTEKNLPQLMREKYELFLKEQTWSFGP